MAQNDRPTMRDIRRVSPTAVRMIERAVLEGLRRYGKDLLAAQEAAQSSTQVAPPVPTSPDPTVAPQVVGKVGERVVEVVLTVVAAFVGASGAIALSWLLLQ